MLKKWLKKRRKSNGRHAAEAATKADKPRDIDASGRRAKQNDGRGKKNKTKAPHGRSHYKNMEKEPSRQPLPPQSFIKTTIIESTPSSVPARHTYGDHVVPISPPLSAPPQKSARVVVHDIKKEVPLVRIRPIEKPKSGTKSRERRPSSEQAFPPPPHRPLLPAYPSASADSAPTTTATNPIIVLPPPAQRPASPLSLITNLAEVPFPSPSPPSPTTDHLSREMSYLGTSPPSIDTTLFAHEERTKADGKDEDHSVDEKSLTADDLSPPTLIEAILPPKQAPRHTPTKQASSPRRSPVEQEPAKLSVIKPVTVHSESDDSEASVRSRSEIIQEIVRPFQDGEFFTATRSQSGSGSKKLETWLDEVLRSIDTHKGRTMTEFDRYHITKKGKMSEEKSDKGESSWTDGETSEVLVRSRNMIDQALKESLQKSKATLTAAPRGILKSKVVESGTVIYDPEKWDYSHSEEEDDDYDEEGEEEGGEEKYAAMDSDESSAEEAVPIKVFSSSRRQKPIEDTEDETVSVESQTSTSEEIAYETLRQLKPTVSRDDTQTSNNSSNFFFNKMCTMSNIILETEEGLCQGDDGVSISEYSAASRSTVSKEDSYITQSGGWMCFDAF